jgi:hypothetical protein
MEDKCRNACIFYEEIHVLFILYEFCLSNYLVINIAFFHENGLHGSSMPYEEFLKVIQIHESVISIKLLLIDVLLHMSINRSAFFRGCIHRNQLIFLFCYVELWNLLKNFFRFFSRRSQFLFSE